MTTERKRDTREKIALGGLIVKAGLRQADRAFLLGVLTEAARIVQGTAAHHRLSAIGRRAFGAEARQPEKDEKVEAHETT